MRLSRFIAVCGGLLLACSLQAGIVLYDNTVPDPVDSDSVQSFGPLYDSFSTGINSGALSHVEFRLSGNAPAAMSFGTMSVGMSVDLFADSGSSTVGSFLFNLGSIDDSSLSTIPSLITLTLVSNPNLDATTRYWIGLTGTGTSANSSWTKDVSGTGVDSEFFQNGTGTFPNNSIGSGTFGAYQMEVEVGAPEPSTLLLAVSSLALLAFLRRRAAN